MPTAPISTELERALTEYVQAAATVLQADVEAGAEVELELGSRRGSGPGRALFYSCRPLTRRFIAERQPVLEALPEHRVAVAALAEFDGLDRYLAGRSGLDGSAPTGLGRRSGRGSGRGMDLLAEDARVGVSARARAAAKWVLQDAFAEQTEFDRSKIGQPPDRLAAALARLERADSASAPGTVTLVATLHGMAIASPEVKLTKGLTIATPREMSWAPPEALAAGEELTVGPEHLLVSLTCEERSVKELAEAQPAGRTAGLNPHEASLAAGLSPREAALATGLEVLKDLLRALRLFGDGRVTLGSLAWARLSGEDAWTTLAVGQAGRPHGMLVVSTDQEDELRAFCSLVSRRSPSSNVLAWALRRFELGCERAHPYDSLSDHLLALRALLEPEGPGSGQLAGRLAALCATPEHRAKLTDRILKAQRLERSFMAGAAPERAASLALAREIADHLRALLRDVICGHLSPDLPRLADQLLSAPHPAAPDLAEPEPAEPHLAEIDPAEPAEPEPDRGQGAPLANGAASEGAQQLLVIA
ncbi:MAG TPA: hypothetical protein VMG80_07875 [Solirubrobacteraceae bacterium]|nr:hypothetical protein [Solirubrobacteraceae bacterium]